MALAFTGGATLLGMKGFIPNNDPILLTAAAIGSKEIMFLKLLAHYQHSWSKSRRQL